MDQEHFALVGLDLYAAASHALYDRTHAVDEAVFFVRVSGDGHSHAFVNWHPEWLCIDLRGTSEVVEVLLRIARYASKDVRIREERAHRVPVHLGGPSPGDGDEGDVRRLLEHLGHVFCGHDVAASAVCVKIRTMALDELLQLCSVWYGAPQQLQLPLQFGTLAPSHFEQRGDAHVRPSQTVSCRGAVCARQLTEVAYEHDLPEAKQSVG